MTGCYSVYCQYGRCVPLSVNSQSLFPSNYPPTYKKRLNSSSLNFDGTKSLLVFRVPTGTGKPGKMGRHFPVREKSGNFEQTGKVRENHTKYWKTQGISDKYYFLFFSNI